MKLPCFSRKNDTGLGHIINYGVASIGLDISRSVGQSYYLTGLESTLDSPALTINVVLATIHNLNLLPVSFFD